MFEIMAENRATLAAFYNSLFGWNLDPSQPSFSYVHFPAPVVTLGGIGDAQPGVPGWEKGVAFYFQVDCVDTTLAKVKELGGTVVVPKTEIPKDIGTGNYVFGMFRDLESNLIGLLQPFTSAQ